jgi:hypothetical protein
MYKSKYTGFVAHNKPLVHTIYVKDENETTDIIYIDDNWNMAGSSLVLRPKGWGPDITFGQADCERMLMKNVPSKNCPDVLEHYGLKEYDTAEIIYRTRGINLLDKTWLAWSKEDKAEDYHPLCNPELMKIRMKDMIQIEDPDIEMPPIGYESEACKETRLATEKNLAELEKKYEAERTKISNIAFNFED